MIYKRLPIEIESPEEHGYGNIKYNLAESSTRDRTLGELGLELNLNTLVLQYGDHRGHPGLRQLLANEARYDQEQSKPEHVLLTSGAAGALFIVATSLLTPKDHLVVLRPNYATNLETPRAIGCEISFVDLSFEQGFTYTASDIAKQLKPNTKLISITTPHNPTGTVLPYEELQKIVKLAEEYNCYLLVDETYRDLNLGTIYPFATHLSERVISVASLSKAYGLPGLRMGWLITRDTELTTRFLAAKEQIMISGSIIDEEISYQVYTQRKTWLPKIKQEVTTGLAMVKNWIAQEPLIQWVEPSGGVVCFPRIKPSSGVDVEHFHQVLNGKFGTFVGPGHWFEQDRRYMRVGFGWPTPKELEAGLTCLSQALREARD
jgi:aspartate/methionine/tyrosine aminotransferase